MKKLIAFLIIANCATAWAQGDPNLKAHSVAQSETTAYVSGIPKVTALEKPSNFDALLAESGAAETKPIAQAEKNHYSGSIQTLPENTLLDVGPSATPAQQAEAAPTSKSDAR